MRYRLQTLLLMFLFVAVFLSGAVPFVRWLNSRPGLTVTDSSHWPHELREIETRLGSDAFQDVQVWHLYSGWFDYVWRAKASPEAVKILRVVTRMNRIQQTQVPIQFWEMPSDWSDMPDWWDPKRTGAAEFYMSPTFIPRIVHSDRLDAVAMYDPDQQMLYVWSQWDF